MYRVSFLDAAGHVRSALDIRCRNDDEAIDRAASLRHWEEFEIWQGDRLVWRFESSHVARPV